MHLDNLSGRRERRLPIAVVVRLEGLAHGGVKECERTYTDNVSAHGARVKTTRLWYPGEQSEITPWNEKSPMRAEVVYCQKLEDAGFFVGLKFPRDKTPWE